jgi:hypothetical protein
LVVLNDKIRNAIGERVGRFVVGDLARAFDYLETRAKDSRSDTLGRATL